MKHSQELAKELSTVAGSILVLTVTFSRDLLEGTGEKTWILAVAAWVSLLFAVFLGFYGLLMPPGYILNPRYTRHLLGLQMSALGIGLVLLLFCGMRASWIVADRPEPGNGVLPSVLPIEPITIKVDPSSAVPPVFAQSDSWGLILISIGLLGLGAGIALLVSSSEARRTAIVLTASGLILATIGGVRLKVPLKIAPKLDINIDLPTNEQSPRFELRHVDSLRTFKEAEHARGVESKIGPLKKKVSKILRESTPIAWLIVGRVDKRNLRPVPARKYGSNQGLAMARAAWVRKEVFSSEPLAKQTFVTIGGPEHLGPFETSDGLAGDRAVEIYALIAERPDEHPGKNR